MTDQMRFASAATSEQDAEHAAQALVAQINARMVEHPVDLAVVFLSPHFTQTAAQIANALHAAFRPGLLLGCSGEGVISAEEEIEHTPAITMVAAHLPDVQLTPFMLQPGDWQSVLNNPALLRPLVSTSANPKLITLLADPLSTPIEEVLETFNKHLEGVPIVGGMASTAHLSTSNALLLNNRVLTGGVIGVTWSGAFQADIIISQGCRPVGHPLTVTSAERNVLVGIEGQPPLVHIHNMVEQLSDQDRALLRSNGLFVGQALGAHSEEPGRGDFLIRNVIGLDRQRGGIVISDVIPEGETIQFHLRDAATAKEDLEMMLLSQAFFEQPRGAFLFSCNGRGTQLYDQPNGDISIIQNALGGVPLAGFFCAGEIGPTGGANLLHSHTVSLALIRPTPEDG